MFSSRFVGFSTAQISPLNPQISVKTLPICLSHAQLAMSSPEENPEETRELPVEELLTRPAEEFGNDPTIEMAWMSTAIRHMETYYKLITSVKSLADIKLTSNDDFIYDTFQEQFPDLNVELLTEEMIKSVEAKEKWRTFCNEMQEKIEDFNFATLMRLNCRQDYNEANTIVVPRAQFIAIEIARNRLGLNSNLPPFTE